MSPQCKPADVLLHADVAIGTQRRLLSIAAVALLSIFHEPSWLPGFLFPWPRCSLMQQIPARTPLGCLGAIPTQRESSAIGWHTDWLIDWLLQPATVPAELTLYTTPTSFHNHLLTGYGSAQHFAQFHTVSDSAIYYSWWICRNVLDRKCLLMLVRSPYVFVPGSGTTVLWGKHDLESPLNV